jgi:hypothetical protein
MQSAKQQITSNQYNPFLSNQSPPTASRHIYSEKKSPDNPMAVASEDYI